MDKLTYEQRVQQMAEQLMFEEYKIESAKIAVESQVEAIRDFYSSVDFIGAVPDVDIDQYLIENGYEPAPEITCPHCGGKYKIHNCLSICDTCGKSIN